MISSWKSQLHGDPTNWLLEESNPFVRYFTLQWLLDKPRDDPEVEAASRAISASEPVKKILRLQRPQGYWGSDSRPHHGTRGPLMVLMWLGYRGNGAVRRAIDYRIDGCIQEDGGYGIEIKGRTVLLPCHGADLLRLMLWFGYAQDPRAEQVLDWLIKVQEKEGVWPCISKVKPFSCLWATAVVLRAYRDLPADSTHPFLDDSRSRAVELFLNSNIYSYGKHKVSSRWFDFGFPLQWDTDILEVLDLVAPYTDPEDTRIQETLRHVLDKQDDRGRWPCEKHPKGGRWIGKYLPLEEIGKPSKWVTLHAMKMLKTLYSSS